MCRCDPLWRASRTKSLVNLAVRRICPSHGTRDHANDPLPSALHVQLVCFPWPGSLPPVATGIETATAAEARWKPVFGTYKTLF